MEPNKTTHCNNSICKNNNNNICNHNNICKNNICINNNSCNNNNQNNNSNFRDQLFKKIWSNKVLFYNILNHIYIYNNLSFYSKYYKCCIKDIKNFKFRYYITHLYLKQQSSKSKSKTSSPSKLNHYYQQLEKEEEEDIISKTTIPYTVTSLILKYNIQLDQGLFNSITDLTLKDYNQVIKDIIPNSVTKLCLLKFDQVIQLGDIPNSVVDLRLESFNKELIPNVSLPSSIKVLNLGSSFNMVLKKNDIPSSVHTLYIGDSFNQQLIPDSSIPSSITTLHLGNSFNQPLVTMIAKIKKIFQKKSIIQRVLPNSIKELVLGSSFNQLILNGYLPDLETLKLGYGFKQVLYHDSLPNSITELHFSYTFYTFDNSSIPYNIKYLNFGNNSENNNLNFNNNSDNNNNSLNLYNINNRELNNNNNNNNNNSNFNDNKINNSNNRNHQNNYSSIEKTKSLKSDFKFITKLVMGDGFDQWIHLLPNTIKDLTLSNSFNNDLTGIAFPSVTKLKFGARFNKDINEGSLPSSITHLIFGNNYNKPFKKYSLPSRLLILELSNEYNTQFTSDSLPSSLTILRFPKYSKFNRTISPGHLPQSLLELSLGGRFNTEFSEEDALPINLKKLTLSNYFDLPLVYQKFNKSLESLSLGIVYDHPIIFSTCSTIPCNIRSSPLLSLTKLTISDQFNRDIQLKELISLKELKFGYSFDRPLHNNSLPPSLIILQFGASFNQLIDINLLLSIPLIRSIRFGKSFQKSNLLILNQSYNNNQQTQNQNTQNDKNIINHNNFNNNQSNNYNNNNNNNNNNIIFNESIFHFYENILNK